MRKTSLVPILPGLLLLISCAPPASEIVDPDLDQGFLLGGIQVNEPNLDGWLDALQAEGMNTISVTDYAKQGDWDTDHLWWDENDGILTEVRGAKERGMKVVLISRVALDHAFEKNRFLWHGMIMPKTDEQIHSWFDQYTRFVLRWAELAEREGIEVLMVGSELNALASTTPLAALPGLEEYFLNKDKQEQRKAQTLAYEKIVPEEHLWEPGLDRYDSLEEYVDARIASEEQWAAQTALTDPGKRPEDAEVLSSVEADARALAQINARRLLLEERWRQLIADVRKVYSGRLGYAANFDQYHLVTFWDALDVMGINAYFQVRDQYLPESERTPERLYPLLENGWSKVLMEIAAFRRDHELEDRPVIFSELGYTFRANSTINPWAHTGFGLIEPPKNENGSRNEGDDDQEIVLVWRDQPVDPTERALAIRALHNAHDQLESSFLEGLLYWKLSTVPGHRDIEPFVLVIGEEEDDPMLPELRRFRER